MSSIAVSALSCLALLLLVSGAAKLAVPETGRTVLSTVSLPRPLGAPWLQRLLPWVEVLLAGGLVLASGAALSAFALAATALFSLFTVVVQRGTSAPDPASCGCFGGLSRAPVSHRTVVRNLFFTLTALLALVLSLLGFHGPVLPLPWWHAAALALPLLLVLVILWSSAPARSGRRAHDVAGVPPLPPSLQTIRGPESPQQPAAPAAPGAPALDGEPARTAEEPQDGAEDYVRLPVPHAALVDADGARVTLRGLAATRARALFRVSRTCGWCAPVIERLAELDGSIGPVAVHAVVRDQGERESLPDALRAGALVDPEGGFDVVFDGPGTPWAVVLGADGLLAGGPVEGVGPVTALLEELQERFTA